jgi:hypothetical protein
MSSEETKRQQHWIYVVGGAELREKARRWGTRKTLQGKAYAVIEGASPGSHSQKLAGVGNEDVLYVFADAVREGKLGEWGFGAEELAAHLPAEGLDRGHRSLKIFASRSGDRDGSACFAEQVYEAMQPAYPHIVVFGYLGQVNAEGFDGHKTAGLSELEKLEGLSREEWLQKGARAQENRVRFPTEGVEKQNYK